MNLAREEIEGEKAPQQAVVSAIGSEIKPSASTPPISWSKWASLLRAIGTRLALANLAMARTDPRVSLMPLMKPARTGC